MQRRPFTFLQLNTVLCAKHPPVATVAPKTTRPRRRDPSPVPSDTSDAGSDDPLALGGPSDAQLRQENFPSTSEHFPSLGRSPSPPAGRSATPLAPPPPLPKPLSPPRMSEETKDESITSRGAASRLGIDPLRSDTPEDVRAWLRSCRIAFATAETVPSDPRKVAIAMNAVRSPLLAAFVDAELETLLTISWDRFAAALTDHVTPQGHDHRQRLALLAFKQEAAVPFAQYAAQVRVLNASLPASSQLDEDRLKELLETNARPLLRARMAMYWDLSTKSWADYVALWKPSKDSARSSARSSRPLSTPASGTSRPSMPKLTQAERNLLEKYRGCFKCRKTLVTHRANDCKVQLTSAPTIVAPSTAEIADFNRQHPDIKVEAAAYRLARSSSSAASQSPANDPAKSILVNGVRYVVADSSAWRSRDDSDSETGDLADESSYDEAEQ